MDLINWLKNKYLKLNAPFSKKINKTIEKIIKDQLIGFTRYDLMYNEIEKKIITELKRILNYPTDINHRIYERNFEKYLANYYDKNYAIGTHSGTAALQLTLTAMGIGEDDEVITVPNTYIATALSISNTGAKPVFVDIDETNTIDVEKIEEKITEKTKAIIPVHLYGNACNMDRIIEIAEKHSLKIIEDCAQAHTTKYNNKRLPYTETGCYSFYTGKIIGGLGNGGAVLTDNKVLKERIEKLRNPESNTQFLLKSKRTPCYLDAIQSVIIKERLKKSHQWTKYRRRRAKYYTNKIENIVKVPNILKKTKHSYYRYVINTDQRDKLRRYMIKNGIETRIGQHKPIHLTKTFKYLPYEKGDFPVAEKKYQNRLFLPCHQYLKKDDLNEITEKIIYFLK